MIPRNKTLTPVRGLRHQREASCKRLYTTLPGEAGDEAEKVLQYPTKKDFRRFLYNLKDGGYR